MVCGRLSKHWAPQFAAVSSLVFTLACRGDEADERPAAGCPQGGSAGVGGTSGGGGVGGDGGTAGEAGAAGNGGSTCADGLVYAEGACRKPCQQAEQCDGSLGCRGGACLPCQNDAECPGQYACRTDWGCVPFCHDDEDCKAGATCTPAGECKALAQTGSACLQADDCESGHCAGGVCCSTACSGGCETCNGTVPGVCEPDSSPTCTVKIPDDAPTLAEALTLVDDGGTVEIGTDLTEAVVVDGDKSVRLRGMGDPAPTLQAPSPAEAALTLSGTGKVYVEHLQLAHSAFGLRVVSPVAVELLEVTAHHNQVGLSVTHGAPWTPEAILRVQESNVWSNTGNGLDVHAAPVEIARSRFGGNLRNIRVEGVHAFHLTNSVVAQSTGRQGVMVIDSDGVVVEGSLFWENYPHGGLWLVDTDDAVVRDCSFQKNSTLGLALLRTSGVRLEHISVQRQFNPRTSKFNWSGPGEGADTTGLDVPSVGEIPMPGSAPDPSVVLSWPTDAWLGNGIEVTDGSHVTLDSVHAKFNEGSGVFARNSTSTDIVWSNVHFNLRNGVSLVGCEGTWLYHVEADFNQRAAVQAWNGTLTVQSSSLSYTAPHPSEHLGVGLFVVEGEHVLESSYLTNEHVVGLMVRAGAHVLATGNEFADSPGAWAYESGSVPAVTWGPGNSIQCDEFGPECSLAMASAAQPSPPPVDPDLL